MNKQIAIIYAIAGIVMTIMTLQKQVNNLAKQLN
jgi:hypothetical protein